MIPRVSYTLRNGLTTSARSSAITPATIPSMRSVNFFLLGFRFPAASVSTATLEAIQRSTGLRPCHSLPETTSFSHFLVGAVISLKPCRRVEERRLSLVPSEHEVSGRRRDNRPVRLSRIRNPGQFEALQRAVLLSTGAVDDENTRLCRGFRRARRGATRRI